MRCLLSKGIIYLTTLARLIAKEEGFGRAGVLPTMRHNPGDLRHSPHSQHPGGPNHRDDIGTIDTDADGWADLERQLKLDAARGLTLGQAIYEWAPPSDHNDTARYLADVVAGFGGRVTPDTLLSEVLRYV
jgi:hypothetical protein